MKKMTEQEIVNKIMSNYELKRGIAEEKKYQEIKEVYEKFSELRDIDKTINAVGFESMRKILSFPGNSKKIKEEFEKKLTALKEEREKIIKENNINPDFNKPDYECKECNDTGYTPDGKMCQCYERELIKINTQNSNIGKMANNKGFSEFSLEYYSSKKDSDGVSPKDVMSDCKKTSQEFCENFDDADYSLFFYGNTGLGKTYLSGIIASEIIKKGKKVNYIRASKMFSDYDDYKFHDYTLKEKIDELYSCDFLVIDDLGSENTSKTGVSFLFDLINDRLQNEKKTLINTNLNLNEFSKVYTVRLTSRIYENFKIFKFEGKDIRIEKLKEK